MKLVVEVIMWCLLAAFVGGVSASELPATDRPLVEESQREPLPGMGSLHRSLEQGGMRAHGSWDAQALRPLRGAQTSPVIPLSVMSGVALGLAVPMYVVSMNLVAADGVQYGKGALIGGVGTTLAALPLTLGASSSLVAAMALRHRGIDARGGWGITAISAALLTPLIALSPGFPQQARSLAVMATGGLAMVGLGLQIVHNVERQRAGPQLRGLQVTVRPSADGAELGLRGRF